MLDPGNSAFYSSFGALQADFTQAMTAFYTGLSPAQQQQLTYRGLDTATAFWTQAKIDLFGKRSLTQQNPGLPNPFVVSLETINSALDTPYFAGGQSQVLGGFGSDYAAQHSDITSKGILESLPHDNIHNDVGGFMGAFLSPIDPVFAVHHANIDRLWTVWDGMQQIRRLRTRPWSQGDVWYDEPFVFFTDSTGSAVMLNTAGAYSEIGSFNYIYTQGSPLDMASSAMTATMPTEGRRVTGTIRSAEMNFARPAVSRITVPIAQHVRAHITIEEPADPGAIRFHVLVNPPQNAVTIEATHPSYAGTIQFFGRMANHRHPQTFTVPLENALERLRRANALPGGHEVILEIQVVPQARGIALRAMPAVHVRKIEVSWF